MHDLIEEMMRCIAIGFHDVVEDGQPRLPRIAGHTTLYTLTRRQLQDHLHAIARTAGADAVRLIDARDSTQAVLLTFDDGAVSAYTCAAPELETFGWRGHFFVTTDWTGRSGFLDRRQIRELSRRGHLIGSHTRSHPERISELSWNDMVREWSESCAVLADIVGRRIETASVPGGYYSRDVARAAAAAGIKVLFTSEPTLSTASVDGCTIVGRYAIRSYSRASVSGSLAAGSAWPRYEQAALWTAKKAAKRLTGRFYCVVRRSLFARTQP